MKTAGGMLALVASVAGCSGGGSVAPAQWFAKDAVHYLDQVQVETRTRAIAATGDHGAVTVAYGPFAARAGLAVLERGGNAMDAALTTAVTQVAVTAGSPVSYFGIMALVYYDVKTGRISTMNAGWNTIKGDTDPLTIPGSIDLGKNVLGTAVSGRTALVGGFMKGVESAHRRFGRREDLAAYDVIWSDPLVRQVGDIEIASLPAPNEGGVALIEAQQLALAAGLGRGGHWSGSGEVLKQTLSIALARMVTYLPDEVQKKRYPDVRFDAESRMTAANARAYAQSIPLGLFIGCSQVDSSLMVARSNTTTSAQFPSLSEPRPASFIRVAGQDVIFRIASGRVSRPSSRTYLAMIRGWVP